MIQQSNPTLGYVPGENYNSKRYMHGASLVAQWRRVHQPIQETWVHSLVQEDIQHATEQLSLWATTTEPVL